MTCIIPRVAIRNLFLALLAVLLTGMLATASPATAQTPAATIDDSDGNVVLQSNEDGGLLAPGEFGTGTIPAEGAGTRLMWYTAQAALRAGAVDGAQWDASNVGAYSAAFGENTRASGPQALAIGTQTVASGIDAFAAGESAEASGSAAVALGTNTQASSDNALATGQCNQVTGPGDLLVVGDGQLDIVSGNCQNRSNALRLTDGGNMTIGNDLTAGGSVFAQDFITTSDRRLKTNIESLGDSILPTLADLRPVRFQFKASTGYDPRPQIGFIAQEMQAAFPSLVHERDDGTLALAYPKLTAVLVKGMQEQQAQIDRQQAAIDSLSREVRSLQEVKQTQDQLTERVAALQQADGNASSSPLPAGWSLTALLAVFAGVGGFAAGRNAHAVAS